MTSKHDAPNYNSNLAVDCEIRGEPCFTLRAQDVHAADAVRFWATSLAAGDAGDEMAERALKIADAMDAWPNHKEPDL
jgi:hypothetical protein